MFFILVLFVCLCSRYFSNDFVSDIFSIEVKLTNTLGAFLEFNKSI